MLLRIINKYKELESIRGVLALSIVLMLFPGERRVMAQTSSESVPEYFVELRELIPTLHLELQ